MQPETLNTSLLLGKVNADTGKLAGISAARSAAAGSAFSAAYKKVAHANKSASRGAAAKTASPGKKAAEDAGDAKSSGCSLHTGLQQKRNAAPAHAAADSNQQASDDAEASGGSAIIRQALLTISQALHLPADSDLDTLLITGADGSTGEQLSDILATLKNISSILGEAASTGTSLDTGSSTIDVQASGNLASLLDSQIFNIELGASMLGIGEQVGSELSQKLDGSSGANIPQAMDPSALSMSAAQLQSLMSGSAPSAEELQALVEKIAALCGSEAPLDSGEDGSKESGSGNSGADSALEALAASMGDATPPAAIMENATSAAPSQGSDESVMQQLAERMQSAVRQGISEIRIQIRPESLGEVKLQIQVDGNVVTAHVQVANQQVQKIIEGSLQSLKDALSEQHLQMGSIDVQVRSDTGGSSDNQTADSEKLPASPLTAETGAADGPETADSSIQPLGLDTGRRFGNNTVEFFA